MFLCGWVVALALAYACARVAVLIQLATRRHFVICSLLTPPYFSTFSHKRYDVRKKVTEHKMCVLIFPTTFI